MSESKERANVADREWILAELARRESGDVGDAGDAARPLDDAEAATIHSLKTQLETLVSELRREPPFDDFAEESGCRLATELVEHIAERSEYLSDQPELTRIGPYEVVAKLSRGGMGTVYKAVHPKLQRTVAIKILPAGRMQEAGAVARFEREMKVIGGLVHRNIVAATDAGEVDGMHYLVMEYVDGVDLSTLVRRVGPLAAADACEIIRQAALGLKEAHERGIIHRDIKPSNLMLTDEGTPDAEPIVKVLDFGLARLAPIEAEPDELTIAGQIMGTLQYMAPEQCASIRDVDARADIYSLGATLYRLLSGDAPFSDGRFDSPLALVAALANESPASLATLRGDLPPRLVAIVERMMAKDPAARFVALDEVLAALAPFSKGAQLGDLLETGRQTASSPGRPEVRAPRSAAVGDGAKPQAAGGNRGRGLGRMLLLSGGILLVTATAIVAFQSLRGDRAATSSPAGASQLTDADRELFERNRRAAEWLSSINARFGVLTPGGTHLLVSPGDPLPTGAIQIQTIDLNQQTKVRDEDLARLRGVTSLRMLGLSYLTISDEGLLRLGPLRELENLFLVGTPVTDRGLAMLSGSPNLTLLYLANTKITDVGLKEIGACKRLNELVLTGCPITDAGLKELHGLKFLRILHVQNTKVTFDGIAELESVLPNCSIESSFTAEKRSD
jgi:serine/threonine protein kinase